MSPSTVDGFLLRLEWAENQRAGLPSCPYSVLYSHAAYVRRDYRRKVGSIRQYQRRKNHACMVHIGVISYVHSGGSEKLAIQGDINRHTARAVFIHCVGSREIFHLSLSRQSVSLASGEVPTSVQVGVSHSCHGQRIGNEDR